MSPRFHVDHATGVVAWVELVVLGVPGPQGSKRFVGRAKKSGRGILVESSAKVKPWREAVRAEAQTLILTACAAHAGRTGACGAVWAKLDGPLRASMVFTLPKPASAPKSRQSWPDRKPDLSKLARSTEDALSDAGLWADDARVGEYAALAKRYPGEGEHALPAPGVWIRVERVR